ncbi:MAG: hypothetical protein BWZ02_02457 [Lentisphaerae bacterium ADurb.BinA184]|nr:MAG: hypothetical protein BWZ02_02457 [Lentisphaerae bacterium ADurb.BinA184]
MKKLLVAGLVSVAACGVWAQGSDLEYNVGVGLGTEIFRGQDGLVQQVLAATTNGSFGNQTFAISSGTLGARQAETLVQNKQLREFVAQNMDNLARDIASGRGETLNAVSDLMAVPTVARDAYHRKLQSSFDRIYSSETVTSNDVVQRLVELRS